MPRRDGTGPNGTGSMTGWGMGLCAATPGTTPGNAGRGMGGGGRGMGGGGRGMGGGGRGCRNMFNATGLPGWARFGAQDPGMQQNPASEQELLKQQADALQRQLDAIHAQLAKTETER